MRGEQPLFVPHSRLRGSPADILGVDAAPMTGLGAWDTGPSGDLQVLQEEPGPDPQPVQVGLKLQFHTEVQQLQLHIIQQKPQIIFNPLSACIQYKITANSDLALCKVEFLLRKKKRRIQNPQQMKLTLKC